jgi:hypothetical protein
VFEPEHAGVSAVLRAREPTFEVDVAGPDRDDLLCVGFLGFLRAFAVA